MMGGGGGGGGLGGWGRLRHTSGGDQSGGKLYDHKVVRRLLIYLLPHWRLVILSCVFMFFYTGTVVLLPRLVGSVIDGQIGWSLGFIRVSNVGHILMLYVVIAFIQFASNYIHLRLMAFMSQSVLYSMRVALFAHIQRLSMSYFDRNEVGRVMSRVQNDVQQLQEFLSIILLTIADVLSLVGIVAMMMTMNFGLAVITLSVVPILILFLVFWQQFARSAFMRTRHTIATVNAGLEENISGMRVVQSLNRGKTNIQRFNSINSENLSANLDATRISAVLAPVVEILMAIGLGLVVFFGGTMVFDGVLGPGVLVAFALYIQRFFDPIRSLTMQYSSLQRSMVAGSRVFGLLDTQTEVQDGSDAISCELLGNISFEQVSLAYKPGEFVLQNVTLNIKQGETVAVVGPSGAGKTSLVACLIRLYDVSGGRILFDGVDLNDIKRDSLVSQIGIVPQEPYLFSGTVEENIRFGRSDTTYEEIKRATEIVGAYEFIDKLDNGFGTYLQERGGNLSIGQRQLICMARAVVGEPKILILDEATANIDTYSESLIQKSLNTMLRNRTAVIIAHRLSTVRAADRIVVMDNGTIVEDGTHQDLMSLGGLYSKLISFSTKDLP